MSCSAEEWKPVVGYEGQYLVSNTGKVWSIRNSKELKQHLGTWGYPAISLCADGVCRTRKVHRLVALAFLGKCPDGHTVNHCDGNKQNNAATNLEYVSVEENIRHAIEMGLRTGGRKPGTGQKLTRDQVREIRSLRGTETLATVAERYGVAKNTISRIYSGEIWASVA